jgi:hypothetical protein
MQSVCERWTSLAQTNKMWAYELLTAQTGGYHGENLAHTGHYNAAPNTHAKPFYTETDDAFTNLAMAATLYKDLISTLTLTNLPQRTG